MSETRRPVTGRHPCVAGAVILDQLKSAEQILGKEAVVRAKASLPDESRAVIEAMLPISWVDLRHTRHLHHAVAKEAGVDVDTWHRRVVRHGIERTLSTVWKRLIVRFVSAETIVQRAAMVYRKTFDTGTLTARILEPGHSEAILEGWPDVPHFDLDGLAVGIETTLRVAGRKHVVVTFERTRDGAKFDIRTDTRD